MLGGLLFMGGASARIGLRPGWAKGVSHDDKVAISLGRGSREGEPYRRRACNDAPFQQRSSGLNGVA